METSLSVVHKVQVQTVNGKFSRRAETEIVCFQVCFQVRQHKSSYGFLYVQEKIETKISPIIRAKKEVICPDKLLSG